MIDMDKSEVVSWSEATYDEPHSYRPRFSDPPHPKPETVTRVVRVLYRGQERYTCYYNDDADDFIASMKSKPIVKG